MPVDILDLELSDREENLTTIAECELRNRKIGFGCVTSADPNVETVEVIEKRILRGIEIFGPEKLIIDPDCGLRLHSRGRICQTQGHGNFGLKYQEGICLKGC